MALFQTEPLIIRTSASTERMLAGSEAQPAATSGRNSRAGRNVCGVLVARALRRRGAGPRRRRRRRVRGSHGCAARWRSNRVRIGCADNVPVASKGGRTSCPQPRTTAARGCEVTSRFLSSFIRRRVAVSRRVAPLDVVACNAATEIDGVLWFADFAWTHADSLRQAW